MNELIHIAFDSFGRNLKLAFNSKSEISAKRTEYSVDDIQKIIRNSNRKIWKYFYASNNYELEIIKGCKTL